MAHQDALRHAATRHGLHHNTLLWFIGLDAAAAFLLSATYLGNWMKATVVFLAASVSSNVPVCRVKLRGGVVLDPPVLQTSIEEVTDLL